MTATADNNNVVFGLWIGITPGRGPIFMMTERVAKKTNDRISGHRRSCSAFQLNFKPRVFSSLRAVSIGIWPH